MGSGERIESGTADAICWVSGKEAVARGCEPGKMLFDGGNRIAAVAILWTGNQYE